MDVLRHRALLRRRLGVFLAHVPVERELVAEPRDQLAEIQPALAPGVATVERRGHRTWGGRSRSSSPGAAAFWRGTRRGRSRRRRCCRRCGLRGRRTTGRPRATARCSRGPAASTATTTAAARAVVVLLLLELEVQVDALGLGVIEDDLPLIQLGDVVVELVVAIDEGPDVVAVSPGVVRHQRHRVHAFRRQVVDGADQRFALGLAPRGIAGLPILDVRRVSVDRGLERARCCRNPRTRAAFPASRGPPSGSTHRIPRIAGSACPRTAAGLSRGNRARSCSTR